MTGGAIWWWVRHAPVEEAAQGLINGVSDVAADLSDDGAIAGLAEQLPAQATWITSTLKRAQDTAAALALAAGAPHPVTVTEKLNEQDFGTWEGMRWSEAAGDAAHPFWEDPINNAAPEGESFADMTRRVLAAVARLDAAHAGGDIVAVAHAGPIRAAIAKSRGLGAAEALGITVEPLSLHVIGRENG